MGRALEIFTYDVFPPDELSEEVKQQREENMDLGAFIKHSDFENEDLNFTANNVPVEQVFTLDHDFVSMQRKRNDNYEQNAHVMLQNYLDGDWVGAQGYINNILETRKDDPIANAFLGYMEKKGFMMPDGWKGVRNIDEKEKVPDMDDMRDGFDDDDSISEDDSFKYSHN